MTTQDKIYKLATAMMPDHSLIFACDLPIDLNACRIAELWLARQTNRDGGSYMPWYRNRLEVICQAEKHPENDITHAAAHSRFHALGVTLGLWGLND